MLQDTNDGEANPAASPKRDPREALAPMGEIAIFAVVHIGHLITIGS
jgi:hypothetical protein